jgi:hypothetical protein
MRATALALFTAATRNRIEKRKKGKTNDKFYFKNICITTKYYPNLKEKKKEF